MEDFKTINFSSWEDKARKDLKTAEAYQNLYSNWDGITIGPYYDQSRIPDTATAFYNHFSTSSPEGTPRLWYNMERIRVTTAKTANARALQALMNGAEGIHFILDEACDAEALLQDILPQYIYLAFTIQDARMADNLRTWLDKLDVDRGQIRMYISIDGSASDFVHHIELFDAWPNIRILHFQVDQDRDQPVADLAAILKKVSDTFEELTNQGVHADKVAGRLTFAVSLGPKFFQEIIRLRALRILVYKLCRAWGAATEPENILIHAVSEPWIREEFQPRGNMIKSATTGIAGVLGGAGLLTVLPEDPESELQQRIARNVSIILKEESYLDKTRDPIGGAYYVETLTDDLARKAWSEFQKIVQV